MKAAIKILLLCVFAAFSVMVKYELRREKSPLQAIKIGQVMPDFTLSNLSGTEFTLTRTVSENKVVMINFWASWCAPCRVEMPGFEKLYTSKGKDGFVILAVNEDEERAKMDEYLAGKPFSFPILLDQDSQLMKRLGVRALPTTILVGADRKVIAVYEGVQEYLEFLIDSQLKLTPAPK